jgi:hypothetical protein
MCASRPLRNTVSKNSHGNPEEPGARIVAFASAARTTFAVARARAA